MAADNLKKLHTSFVDNRKGYEKAVEDAEPNVKALFSEMATLKAKDHAELHAGLTKLGEEPDDSGSFMATVHKTVIGVRAATTGLGTNSLSSFVMGEKAGRRRIRHCDQRLLCRSRTRRNTYPTKADVANQDCSNGTVGDLTISFTAIATSPSPSRGDLPRVDLTIASLATRLRPTRSSGFPAF